MSIGICIISRSRPEQLKRCIESFRQNQTTGNVFYYVGVDSDDPALPAYNQLESDYVTIIDLGYSQNKPEMARMMNTVALSCNQEIIGQMGDDCICETRGWDTIITSVADSNKDGIYLIYGCDGIQDMRLATHPFIGRKYLDIMGEMFPNEILVDYTDVYTMQVFTSLGRCYHIPSLMIRHNHPIKTGQADHLYLRNRMYLPESAQIWERVKLRIPATITKIQNYMEGYERAKEQV